MNDVKYIIFSKELVIINKDIFMNIKLKKVKIKHGFIKNS